MIKIYMEEVQFDVKGFCSVFFSFFCLFGGGRGKKNQIPKVIFACFNIQTIVTIIRSLIMFPGQIKIL